MFILTKFPFFKRAVGFLAPYFFDLEPGRTEQLDHLFNIEIVDVEIVVRGYPTLRCTEYQRAARSKYTPEFCKYTSSLFDMFDHVGNYMFSFGQYGFDERSFTLPIGIAVAEDGDIYVTDSQGGRVLVFDPLDLE